ncbi:elongation factor G, partial [Salinispira pacifica]
GKTSLVEQILFYGGAIQKPEPVESGRTVSDHTAEEIEHRNSIHTSLSHINWKDHKINLLDTPGLGDFVGEVVAAFRAAESAAIVVSAKSGVQIETIKLWRRLDRRNMPRIVIINQADMENSDFGRVLDDLRQKFEGTFVPVSVPMGSGGSFKGVVDLLSLKAYSPSGFGSKETAGDIPDDQKSTVEEYRASLMESAAEGDDELINKYLEEESLTDDEILRGLTAGLQGNKLIPVLCCSAAQGSGVTPLLDFLATAAPSPAGIPETAYDKDDKEMRLPITTDGALAAFSFKTSIDQFSGKLSFVKVVNGVMRGDSDFLIFRSQHKEKVGKLYTALGKKLEDTGELTAGDIGIMAKVNDAGTNDTFCSPERMIHFKPLQLPQPVHAVSVSAGAKKDEDKLAQQLQRTVEEDPTFIVNFNSETKETVISGMGELHLNIILDKIRKSQKIEIETGIPKVAYRETITKPSDSLYRHKKQTGGHGQFAEVSISVKPLERGQYYSFDNAIRGMAVSKGYIPGIEKGLHEAMENGVLAGYPVVDVGVTLLDGKEHPVDSSEMAFKLASREALKAAMLKANPTLLEPIMNLSVFIDEQYLGDVLSDLSSRRGRVLGQEQLGGGIIEIKAQVPQAELLRYAIDLKSITSGTGGFEVEFDHYSPISGKIADDIIKQAEAAREAG